MQGWECPKCGNVYGPFVSGCQNCNGDYTVTSGWDGLNKQSGGCHNDQCFCTGNCYADRPKGM